MRKFFFIFLFPPTSQKTPYQDRSNIEYSESPLGDPVLLCMLMCSCIFPGQAQEAEQVVQLEIDTPETANEGPSRNQLDEKSPDQSPDEAANQSSACLELDQSQDEDNDVSIQDESQTKQEEEETEQSTQENLVRAVFYINTTQHFIHRK